MTHSEQWAQVGFYFLMVFLLLVTVEDLFLDAYAFIKKKRPQELSDSLWNQMLAKPEKHIAIMIANWHEAGVIEKMISGNLKRIQYERFHFFIGVYPNDPETIAAAESAATLYPDKVHVVVNPLPGPTSKGQMLNVLIPAILKWENSHEPIDLFLMQDSEDIIHPRALKVINSESEKADFIQTPIFSFARPLKEFVGATYLDEFSELHTKDLLVREGLGAPVPSAGVGTCLSRALMLALMKANRGGFLREDSLTEDYVLGLCADQLGFKTKFSCYYYMKEKGRREVIATREYFPAAFTAAVRQKSRWITGIAFQSWEMIPWQGSWAHRLFLWRDRRGPLTNLLSLILIVLSFYLTVEWVREHRLPAIFQSRFWLVVNVVVTVGVLSRLYHRARALCFVYGQRQIWQFPWRWILGIIINVVASARALYQYLRARITRQPLRWVKTSHVLPENFGEEAG